MRVAAKALTIYTAPTFEIARGRPPSKSAVRVDCNAVRSIQPHSRWRIRWLGAASKAFARARKRPRTKLAALIHRVPAGLDPTNVGLHVIDVVWNEIIHSDHL